MITKQDLDSAIAECQGDPNPNAQTCMKLASFYTIQDHLYGTKTEPEPVLLPQFSMDSGTVSYEGDSDFAKAVAGRPIDEILPLMDELMGTIAVLQPRLYKSVMRRLEK